MDSVVLLKNAAGNLRTGKIKYIGLLPGFDQLAVGLEMVCFLVNCEFLMHA